MEPFCFVFVCVLVILESFCRVIGNGHHNTEFRFVDLEHAEFCLESPIHYIRCHLSGNLGRTILLSVCVCVCVCVRACVCACVCACVKEKI